MFDMGKQSDIGYKLVIIYNAEQKKYYLSGYTAYRDGEAIKYSLDGAVLPFDTMQGAMDSIINYPEKK